MDPRYAGFTGSEILAGVLVLNASSYCREVNLYQRLGRITEVVGRVLFSNYASFEQTMSFLKMAGIAHDLSGEERIRCSENSKSAVLSALQRKTGVRDIEKVMGELSILVWA